MTNQKERINMTQKKISRFLNIFKCKTKIIVKLYKNVGIFLYLGLFNFLFPTLKPSLQLLETSGKHANFWKMACILRLTLTIRSQIQIYCTVAGFQIFTIMALINFEVLLDIVRLNVTKRCANYRAFILTTNY